MTFRLHEHSNGTHTLVDEENGQAMHSRIGPEREADLVYAEPARIEHLLDDESREHILYDVGMGTGANVAAVLARIRRSSSARGRLSVYSFESKPDGLRTALENLSAFPELREWADPLTGLFEKSESCFVVGKVEVRWRLFAGDFYERLEEAPEPDTIFFDFYSPKVVPELWSWERFMRLREKIGDSPARLFTYSAATPVRLHLLAAGFYVGTGASTRVKNETTVAATRFDLLVDPLPRSWLRKLTTSASIKSPEFATAKSRATASPQWND